MQIAVPRRRRPVREEMALVAVAPRANGSRCEPCRNWYRGSREHGPRRTAPRSLASRCRSRTWSWRGKKRQAAQTDRRRHRPPCCQADRRKKAASVPWQSSTSRSSRLKPASSRPRSTSVGAVRSKPDGEARASSGRLGHHGIPSRPDAPAPLSRSTRARLTRST